MEAWQEFYHLVKDMNKDECLSMALKCHELMKKYLTCEFSNSSITAIDISSREELKTYRRQLCINRVKQKTKEEKEAIHVIIHIFECKLACSPQAARANAARCIEAMNRVSPELVKCLTKID